MKVAIIAALSIATATTSAAAGGAAHADPIFYNLQSPSGDIHCEMTSRTLQKTKR